MKTPSEDAKSMHTISKISPKP